MDSENPTSPVQTLPGPVRTRADVRVGPAASIATSPSPSPRRSMTNSGGFIAESRKGLLEAGPECCALDSNGSTGGLEEGVTVAGECFSTAFPEDDPALTRVGGA